VLPAALHLTRPNLDALHTATDALWTPAPQAALSSAAALCGPAPDSAPAYRLPGVEVRRVASAVSMRRVRVSAFFAPSIASTCSRLRLCDSLS
jgi:hypothetical protein